MSHIPRLGIVSTVCLLLAHASGCGPTGPNLTSPEGKAMEAEVNEVVAKVRSRHPLLVYRQVGDFLPKLETIQSYIDAPDKEPPMRLLPELELAEESKHYREAVRRWEAETGKTFKDEVEGLKANPITPELLKRFGDLLTIENQMMKEWRNQVLHEEIKPVFDKHRAAQPELVKHFEGEMNKPPHALTIAIESKPAAASKESKPPAASEE